MTKKTSLILLAAITLFSFISCNQNVDTNTYVKNSSDFNSLAEGEWRISTVPEGTATFNVDTNTLTIKSNSSKSISDTFSYFFRDGKLVLRDIDPNGEYKALNNASTRVTLLNCSYDMKGSLKEYDLGLHDLGINLIKTLKKDELAFEANFADGWIAKHNGKTAKVSINPKNNEMIFTVDGGTNPTIASYKVKSSKNGEVKVMLGNMDYTSDFYFNPGELAYKPLSPNEKVEISVELNEPVILEKPVVNQ